MLAVYLLIALVTVAYALYLYFTRTFNYWKSRGVIGPKPVPFFGNLKQSALRRINMGVVFKAFYDDFPNEKVVGVYRMTTPCLLLRDLDIIKHIMIKDFDMFVDRGVEFSKEGLGANLFHSDGDTWRVLRNRFTPVFTSGKLKNMLYLITDRGESFMEYVGQVCDQQPEHLVHPLVQKYTMSTIAACAFGLDIDAINDKLETLQKIDELILTSNFAHELDMMFPGLLKRLNLSLFPSFVNTFFFDLVKQIFTERNGVPGNRKDFMDLILEMKQQGQVYGSKRNEGESQLSVDLTDGVIAAQAFVFYVAGYETSATTMSFLLYELARNPDIQEKLHTETIEVLNRHNGKMTYEALQDMSYLIKVFDETLRMYPLVEPLQRNAQVDYKIPGTNVVIKKGTTVLVSPLGIHHDPNYYPDPEKFNPERFSAENSQDRHACAYMPFGVGPRNCIGLGALPGSNFPEGLRAERPYFDDVSPRNVTSVVGQVAVLRCRAKHIGNRTVSWMRKRDLHILTSHIFTYTGDARFSVLHPEPSDDWDLKIDYVQPRDAGVYECQINTEPKINMAVILLVEDESHIPATPAPPRSSAAAASIWGSQDVYVKRGSTISLTCSVNVHSSPPSSASVLWYHGTSVVDFDSPRGGISLETEKTEGGTTSKLLVTKASLTDSGNYTCVPSNAHPASVSVHVLNGEHPAAMQTSNRASSYLTSQLSCALVTYLVSSMVCR